MQKLKLKKKTIIIIISVIVLILIDQIIKFLVVKKLGNNSINVIPNFLNLTYTENTGGAFGIGQNNTAMFIITNIIVLGIIIKFMITQKNQIDTKTNVVLVLILAGGFSNLIDRIIRGFVVDYIDITPIINFPKFNLADMFIVCGWVLLVAFIAVYTVNLKKKE